MIAIAESWDLAPFYTRRVLLRTGFYSGNEVLEIARIEWKHLTECDKAEITVLHDRLVWLVESLT